MRTGKIQIRNKATIAKALNRSGYLIYIVLLIFIVVNIDLFSAQPKYLKTDGHFWKGIAIVFQLLFLLSLFKWDLQKKKVINILHNGMIVHGELKMSEKLRPNNTSFFYIHLFEYVVNGSAYEVSIKNKSKMVNSNYIIYNVDNPKQALVFEDLKPSIKTLISQNL